MRRLVIALAMVLSSITLATPSQADAWTVSSARAPLPTKAQWQADVREVMAGSKAYLQRVADDAKPGERLAINLDIDNTMLATHYAAGSAVGPVLAFARKAESLGIAVLVNTARKASKRAATVEELAAAGYEVDGICMRKRGDDVEKNKQRCRASFVDRGYRLVANVGNNATDFAGGGYDKAYRLPSYGKRLS